MAPGVEGDGTGEVGRCRWIAEVGRACWCEAQVEKKKLHCLTVMYFILEAINYWRRPGSREDVARLEGFRAGEVGQGCWVGEGGQACWCGGGPVWFLWVPPGSSCLCCFSSSPCLWERLCLCLLAGAACHVLVGFSVGRPDPASLV